MTKRRVRPLPNFDECESCFREISSTECPHCGHSNYAGKKTACEEFYESMADLMIENETQHKRWRNRPDEQDDEQEMDDE